MRTSSFVRRSALCWGTLCSACLATTGCATQADERAVEPTAAFLAAAQTGDVVPSAVAAPIAPVLQALNALIATGIPGAARYTRDVSGNVRTLTAELGNRTPATPIDANGLMMVASITKMYIATIAVQRAAQGVLSLDDTVSRWVPGVLPYGNRITLRQLLLHTAGVNTGEEQPSLYPYWGLTWGSCIRQGICWCQLIDLVRAFDNLPQAFAGARGTNTRAMATMSPVSSSKRPAGKGWAH